MLIKLPLIVKFTQCGCIRDNIPIPVADIMVHKLRHLLSEPRRKHAVSTAAVHRIENMIMSNYLASGYDI